MAQLKPVRIRDLQGGLSKADDTIIKDNQLSEALNVFYNQDKNLQTRYGQAEFGARIPDSASLIEDTDNAAAPNTWAATEDAVNLTANTTTHKRGTGAINFDVTVATTGNDYAIVTCAIASAIDISTDKGSLNFWFKVPTAGTTDLTSLTVRWGSDSSNYYEWVIPAANLDVGQNYIILEYAAATTVLTPVDTVMDYLEFRLDYAATYTDKTDFEICSIWSCSDTYTKPMMSLKYFKAQSTGAPRYLLTNVGDVLYLYNEDNNDWEPLKGSLTEGTRFGFMAYKNVMYLGNGVDNYFSFDGTVCTEHTGANTYRGPYMLLANDVGYSTDPSVPSSLAYTGGTPANLQTFTSVLVCDEDDSSGGITGLINLGPIVMVMKTGKIYKVNTATPSREQIDYSEGFLSDRALTRVENEVFGINKSGVYTLAQREATTGSIRADALSDDIKQIIDTISDYSIVNAIYVSKLKNCYFFIDSNDDGKPDQALVFSVLTKKWTRYTNMNVNEAVIYEDADGVEHILTANSVNGQCREIETGLLDIESEINAEIQTKSFDFEQPETYKTYEMVELHGFISEDAQITANIYVDDRDATGDVFINGVDYVSEGTSGFTLGTHPLGVGSLAGSGVEDTTIFYAFKLRIPMYSTGSNIQIKLRNNTINSQWIITKASIYPYPQPVDVYPYNLIA